MRAAVLRTDVAVSRRTDVDVFAAAGPPFLFTVSSSGAMASETPVHTCCGRMMRAYRTTAQHRKSVEGLEFTVICESCGRWYDTYPGSVGANDHRQRPTFRPLYVPGQDGQLGAARSTRNECECDEDGGVLDPIAQRVLDADVTREIAEWRRENAEKGRVVAC